MAPARHIQLAQTRTVAQAQWQLTADWLRRLHLADWTRSSVLDGWTVSDVVAHLGIMFRLLEGMQRSTDRPLSTSDYMARYRPDAAEIATTAVRFRSQTSVTELLTVVHAEAMAAWLHIDTFVCSDVVRPIQDPIRLDDYMATRVVELVVHTDDLAASLPDRPAPGLDPAAVAIAVRVLLDVVAERAPGERVELRVPPHAAVRCIEAPRQTGGIPPSIVQMDQLTWLRLASGRVPWADAPDLVHAIGEHADLPPHLPLI